MKKAFTTAAVVMLILLATTSMVFASNGNGPDYDLCPKDYMEPADVARFEEIVEQYQAAMAGLRGNPDAYEERLSLKEAKRDALLEIVPDGFEDRFGNFNTETQGMRHGGGVKGSGNKSAQ